MPTSPAELRDLDQQIAEIVFSSAEGIPPYSTSWDWAMTLRDYVTKGEVTPLSPEIHRSWVVFQSRIEGAVKGRQGFSHAELLSLKTPPPVSQLLHQQAAIWASAIPEDVARAFLQLYGTRYRG